MSAVLDHAVALTDLPYRRTPSPSRDASQTARPGAAETVMTDDAFSPLGRTRSDHVRPPSCEIDTPESETVQAHVPAKPTCPESR
jgi:hypothetical protein